MADPAAAVEFRVLGAVEASRDGSAIPLGGPRQRALLALLLSANRRPVTSDRLIDELWHGRPPPGARTTLQTYVSRLRSAVGDAAPISSSAAGYALDVPDGWIDARRFELLAGEGREALGAGRLERAAERLRDALGLWGGRPFGELADEGLLLVEAERLEALRLAALEDRIEVDLELGRASELVEELERLVAEHPYREGYWRQLMLALYRSHRQADALAAYQRARSVLDDELGIEPSEELKRLERAILRHEVPDARPLERRHNLPAPVTSFVGREAELEEVASLLGDARLVTLTGVGGVGKTRLALEVARRALPDFADGVLFVDLAPVAGRGAAVARIAAALGVTEQAGELLADTIASHVSELELLLVLDNCEHVRDDSAEAAHSLLSAAPRLHVLATSRELLGAPGETTYAVPPLELPPPGASPDELRDSDAVRLLLERAHSARPGAAEDEHALAAAGRICADLDGLPLAIELAAARTRALSLGEIETRLRDRFRFLVSWRRLSPARHRTLEEAMDWSYELLAESERTLLARLSVFSGGFTLAAAAAVCLDGDDERALGSIERLVDASLVVAQDRGETTRYGLLETVRQYAAERLRERGETDDLRRRHAGYVADLLATEREAAAGNLERWLASVQPDVDNISAALVWTRDAGTPEEQLRLAQLAWRLWWVRGSFTEGREWLETAIERGPDADAELRALALEGAAGLAWAHGDLERARDAGDQARRLYVPLGDLMGEANATTILGHVAIARGEFELAEQLFERTRVLGERQAREVDARRGPRTVALATLNLASVAHAAEELERADLLYDDARELYKALGDRLGSALVGLFSGALAAERGHVDEAAAGVSAALPVFEELGFEQYTWQCVETAASVARDRGDSSEAVRLLGAATRLRERVGNRPSTWDHRLRARTLAATREELGGAAFSAAWEEGRSLSKAEAVARAQRLLAP